MIDAYTRLLEVAAETGDKKVADLAVAKLVKHLEGQGQVRMLTKIRTELRKIAARRKALAPYVEVASAGESRHALAEAKAHGIVAEHAVVNPTLGKGYRARGAGVLVDRSAKNALIQIYRNVIT